MIKEETPCFPSEYCHETPLSEGSECDYDLQCESLTCFSSQCTAPQNSSQIFNKQIQSRETAVSSTSEVRILSNTSSYYYYSPSTYSSSYYYYPLHLCHELLLLLRFILLLHPFLLQLHFRELHCGFCHWRHHRWCHWSRLLRDLYHRYRGHSQKSNCKEQGPC